jgi:hypothetical protein
MAAWVAHQRTPKTMASSTRCHGRSERQVFTDHRKGTLNERATSRSLGPDAYADNERRLSRTDIDYDPGGVDFTYLGNDFDPKLQDPPHTVSIDRAVATWTVMKPMCRIVRKNVYIFSFEEADGSGIVIIGGCRGEVLQGGSMPAMRDLVSFTNIKAGRV